MLAERLRIESMSIGVVENLVELKISPCRQPPGNPQVKVRLRLTVMLLWVCIYLVFI
jgi:hypothetical protein